jgi:hypothetical protein
MTQQNMTPSYIAKKIMSVEIGDNYDNLAIIICSYFDEHPDNPNNGELDSSDWWEKWTIDRYEEFKEAISDCIAEHLGD